MYRDNELAIRSIEKGDLYRLWELIYKDDNPEWKKWDAPYFPHQSMSYEKFMEEKGPKWIGKTNMWVITVDDVIYGDVSY